jgi:hypothetical protein
VFLAPLSLLALSTLPLPGLPLPQLLHGPMMGLLCPMPVLFKDARQRHILRSALRCLRRSLD